MGGFFIKTSYYIELALEISAYKCKLNVIEMLWISKEFIFDDDKKDPRTTKTRNTPKYN